MHTSPVGPREQIRGNLKPRRSRRSKGFSLIELMVALVIASILLIALSSLFVNNTSARNELEKSSRQIENGRYAMQILADDIRHAGYYGPLISAPALPGSYANLPDACSTTTTTVRDGMGLPVQGYEGAATAAALDSGKVGLSGTTAAGYKANTAVLVVRRAHTSIAASAANEFQHSGQRLRRGHAAVRDGRRPAGTFNLHANTAPGCMPLSGAPGATIAPFLTRIYFISTCSRASCASGADTVPTLKRIDITPTSTDVTPIVDGIENMQFDYGIDTSPFDGVPDVYTNDATAHAAVVPTLPEWSNVMAVRIYLLARNVESSGAFTDVKTYRLGPVNYTPGGNFKRHAYTELVRLVNPSGRRE